MGNTLGAAFDHFYGITGGKALALLHKFRNEDFEFGLDVDQLSQLLEIEDSEMTASIMSSFDTQSSGTISGLDLLCGLLLVSRSDIDNKLEGVFKAFDFRDAGHISFDELVVLLQTMCVGLAVVSGSEDPLPDERQMEVVAVHAFGSTGKNVDLENRHHELVWATISLREFSAWAKASLDLAEDDVGEDVTLEVFMKAIDRILGGGHTDVEEASAAVPAAADESGAGEVEANVEAAAVITDTGDKSGEAKTEQGKEEEAKVAAEAEEEAAAGETGADEHVGVEMEGEVAGAEGVSEAKED